MADAAYYREYRARRRLAGNPIPPSRTSTKGNRAAQNERRTARRQLASPPPLGPLKPALQGGVRIAFWSDELRLDLAQERELALLEGRDPDEAVRVYRARETNWAAHTVPLPDFDP